MATNPPILNDDQREFLATPRPLPEKLQRQDRPEFSGFTIVRLAPEIPIEDIKDLRQLAEVFGLDRLQSLLADIPEVRTERLIQSISLDQLQRIERRTTAAKRPPKFSLASFWRLDTRQIAPDQRQRLIEQLNQLPEVGNAIAELATYNPTMAPVSPAPSFQNYQLYRAAAPLGINLDGLQGLLNTCGVDRPGEGVQVVDLEQGWVFDHVEFSGVVDSIPITGESNTGDLDALDHGTSVLGIICAQDETSGIIGIAPNASVRVVSHYGTTPITEESTGSNVADAIVAAVAVMNPGDILLLEAEEGLGYPTEIQEQNFIAIENAVQSGIIVVEAAGNGNFNLDAIPNFAPDAPSSGAIMVAASAFVGTAHPRVFNPVTERGSNYGDRIDCFAQGSIAYTSAGKTGTRGSEVVSKDGYTPTFGGTSSAAAIIAGAVAVIQGMHLEQQQLAAPSVPPVPLTPEALRTAFSSPLDTPSVSNTATPAEPIKHMPNLVQVAKRLNLCPCPVIAAILSNVCTAPGEDSIGLSADILTSLEEVTVPGRVFGDRTQFGNDFLDLAKVVAGRENFIYVRIRNRSGIPAERFIARVYAAPFSTLITPDQLTLVGESEPISIPIGCNPVITQPIPWKPQQSIGDGYTLIAEVVPARSEQRPLSKLTWQEFLATLCQSEQVAQRSIQVVEVDEPNQSTLSLPFLLKAPPDGRPFTLEILRQLPQGVELQLEVPKAVFEAIAQNSCIDDQDIDPDTNPNQTQGPVRFRLSPLTRLSFPRILLAENKQFASTLIVRGTQALGRGTYSIAVRQTIGRQELGRVTFVRKPPTPSTPPTFSLPPLRRIIDLIRRRLS